MAKLQDYPVNLKDAAHQLGCTCNAVRRLAAAGKIDSERFGPMRELRFREDSIEEFKTKADPSRVHRRLVQRIKATGPHYQGVPNQQFH